MGTINPDCRWFRGLGCRHPARRRSLFNPFVWVGLRAPACRLVLDPFGRCALRESPAVRVPPPALRPRRPERG